MPASSESLQLLAELHRSADAPRRRALADAYQRYLCRMIVLLRGRLGASLRQRADPADLAQSAWCSFLSGFDKGRLDLEGLDSLWPLLACIAVRKFHDLVEQAHAKKRDINRETSLDAARPGADAWEPLGSEPSPQEEAAAQETTDLIASRLSDERQRQILALRLDGCSVPEISEQVQLSERTVKRVLRKIRELYVEVTGLTPPGDVSGLPE